MLRCSYGLIFGSPRLGIEPIRTFRINKIEYIECLSNEKLQKRINQ